MKINKITTLSFAISGEIESEVLGSFKQKAGELEKQAQGFSYNIVGKYIPLIKLKAVKEAKKQAGAPVIGEENCFYVNLTNLDLYYMRSKDYLEKAREGIGLGKKKKTIPQIDKTNILAKLMEVTPEYLETIGRVRESGTTPLDGLDVNAVNELVKHKLVEAYSPQDKESIMTMIFRDIGGSEVANKKYFVKPLFHIPRFTDLVYDLSKHLKTTDVAEESYAREGIKHTTEKIIVLLGALFKCTMSVAEVVYLPCLECKYRYGGKEETELQYIFCPLSEEVKKYENPKKLKQVMLGSKGHGLYSVPIEATAINFSNVAGLSKVKDKIRKDIVYPLTHPELIKEFGEKGGGGILFYGPPGCGKTYIARATVGECGVDFFTSSIQDIVGQEPAAAAKNLHDVFEEARKSTPCILFFDEIDALGGQRGMSQSQAEKMLINQFLTEMDGVTSSNENILIIASTNAPWEVDSALRRAGRFTNQIFLSSPDLEARESIFRLNTKERPIAEDVDFKKLAELTEQYSGADIAAICEDASEIPLGEAMSGGLKRRVQMQDFTSAIKKRDSSLKPWFMLARREIEKSGEVEIYGELWDYLNKVQGGVKTTEPQKPQPDTELEKLMNEKSIIERKIELLRKKYGGGEMSKEVFDGMLGEYEKKLIDIEIKLDR